MGKFEQIMGDTFSSREVERIGAIAAQGVGVGDRIGSFALIETAIRDLEAAIDCGNTEEFIDGLLAEGFEQNDVSFITSQAIERRGKNG